VNQNVERARRLMEAVDINESDRAKKDLTAEITRLKSQIAVARAALKTARDQFRQYHANHMNKTPPDFEKAETNGSMMLMCSQALAQLAPTPGET
jgi:hypothetical protein